MGRVRVSSSGRGRRRRGKVGGGEEDVKYERKHGVRERREGGERQGETRGGRGAQRYICGACGYVRPCLCA